MTLSPGLERTETVVVTREMSPPHLLPTVVLSTPKMIEWMENTCLNAAQSHLDDDQTSVGVHVDVSHEAAVREGEEVVFSARLAHVDGRRLTFEVSARVGDRIVGRGTHQRFVIDRRRFAPTR